MKKWNSAVVKAIFLGGLCSLAYLAVYVVRNVLGATTPQITAEGSFSVERIGSFSSAFFICYAVGQLVNGILGDKIKAKYMICLGLGLASIGIFLLPQLVGSDLPATVAYASTGFCLAMIYGPMTKVVAENTEPIYATRCSLGYTVAAALGAPAAGLLAAFLAWKGVFRIAGVILVVMSVLCFLAFTAMERKGMVKYGQFQPPKKGEGSGIRLLIKRRIIKFTVIAILTGVIRTTVVFWLPTYISQHLGFDENMSAILFTVASLGISFNAVIAVSLYEMLKRNLDLTIFVMFAVSAVSFLMVYLIPDPVVNIIFMVLAIIGGDGASSMMWSRYCPSLYDTGMVSGATGFLDCCSYLAAAAASALFANAVGMIGWGWLILIWFALMAIGVVISFPRKTAQN